MDSFRGLVIAKTKITEKNLLLGMTQMNPTPWVLQSKEFVAMPSIWLKPQKKMAKQIEAT